MTMNDNIFEIVEKMAEDEKMVETVVDMGEIHGITKRLDEGVTLSTEFLEKLVKETGIWYKEGFPLDRVKWFSIFKHVDKFTPENIQEKEKIALYCLVDAILNKISRKAEYNSFDDLMEETIR